MPAERFAPLWITIDPGDRALEGAVSIVLPQDAVQEIRLVAPFAAAPGRPATVEFAASLPPSADRAVVEVRDQSGRLVASQTWTSAPGRREAQFPPGLFLYDDIIASVGVDGFPVAAKAWTPGLAPIPSRQAQYWSEDQAELGNLFQHISVIDMRAEQLPTAWIAYESLRCLVLDAGRTRSISPAAAAAIRDWVLDGGRLVVMAAGPGAGWVEWLSDAALPAPDATEQGPSLAVTLDHGQRIPPPEPLALAVATTPRGDRATAAVLSPSLTVRPIRLTELGRSLGWRTHWPISDADGDPSTPVDERPALLAEGPLGLGFVCLVGFDPADALLGVNRPATATLWTHVLAGTLEPFGASGDRRDHAPPWGGQLGSGDHPEARAGIAAGLDDLADVDVPSGTAFYVLAGACALLALLVGPVDAVLLKRLGRRQSSWLTALGWIGLASLVAYAIPVIGRETEGRLGRLNVVDQIHDQRGSPTLARQAALTAIFSSRAGNATLETHDDSAWWRTVSSVTTYYYGQRRRITGSPVTLAVGEARQDQPTGAGATRPGRAATLRSIPMPMWTLRTLFERGRGALPIAAQATRQPDGWRVSLAGLPDAATISSAALEIGDSMIPLTFTLDPSTGQHIGIAGPSEPGGSARRWRATVAVPRGDRQSVYGPSILHDALARTPGQLLRIMGPDARSDAIDRMRRTGRWCVVYLSLANMPADARTNATEVSTRTVVARLVLPLREPVEVHRVTERWTPPVLQSTPAGSERGQAPARANPDPPPDDQPDPAPPDAPTPPEEPSR